MIYYFIKHKQTFTFIEKSHKLELKCQLVDGAMNQNNTFTNLIQHDKFKNSNLLFLINKNIFGPSQVANLHKLNIKYSMTYDKS